MSTEDKQGFIDIFWMRVCQRYRYLKRNTNTTDYVFDFSQIRRSPNEEGGLGIGRFDDLFIRQMLNEFQTQGLIRWNPGVGQFILSSNGIEYCERLPVTYG